MTENATSRVNAELLAQKSRSAVFKAIRRLAMPFAPRLQRGFIKPIRWRKRLVAPAIDGMLVTTHCVSLTGLLPGVSHQPELRLAGPHWHLAIGTKFNSVVQQNPAGRIQDDDDFPGPHSGQPLELDHGADVAVDVLQHGVDLVIGYRADRCALEHG